MQLADDAGDMLSVGIRGIKELCRLLEKDHQHLADLRVWRVLAALYPKYCDCESLMPAPNLLILSIAACCRGMSSKYVGRFQLYDLLNGVASSKGDAAGGCDAGVGMGSDIQYKGFDADLELHDEMPVKKVRPSQNIQHPHLSRSGRGHLQVCM